MAFECWLHCDDVGISHKSVETIWPLYQTGRLQGASLFVNGPGTEEFLNRVARTTVERYRLAAHLTLTNGPSVLPRERLSLLVDKQGNFCRGFLWFLLANFFHPQKEKLLQQMESELSAQLEKFRIQIHNRGIANFFLGYDGHNHIHMIPMVYRILRKRFPELRARTVFEPVFFSSRLRDQLRLRYFSNWPKLLLLRALNFINNRDQTARRACLGILYSGVQNARTLRSGIEKSRQIGVEELEVIVHALRVGEEDHEGDHFGQDLLDFLRDPRRLEEAQATLEKEELS